MMTKVKYIVCGICIICGFSACADWDDHYDAETSVVASQKSSLWANISQAPNLSQFADLLKKTGYEKVLDAPQTYTVWAPENDSFDYAALMEEGSARLQREFVENHIARNNYPVSGVVNQKVNMLNKKMMYFIGDSTYSMGNVAVDQVNLSCGNGVVHTLKGKIPYLPNIYESLNNEVYLIDSISDYFHKYDDTRIDEALSVQGPTKNGEMTYLDTVLYQDNSLYRTLNAYINREDSNYSMLVPTNTAWENARKEIDKYYNYIPSFRYREDVGEKKDTLITIKDADAMKDSMKNVALTMNLFYNNNLYDNNKLSALQDGATLQCDSLYSTRANRFYTDDAAELFKDARRVDRSNGIMWVTDQLNMKPWIIWNPALVYEAESKSLIADFKNVDGDPERHTVHDSLQLSNNGYVETVPSSSIAMPEISYYLPHVRSAEYAIFVRFVPANITDKKKKILPNRVLISLFYADANGNIKEKKLRKEGASNNYVVTDETKIDNVFLGNFNFPMCYEGLGDGSMNFAPYITIRSSFSTDDIDNYDRTIRIDRILLLPTELLQYLEQNPDYKWLYNKY